VTISRYRRGVCHDIVIQKPVHDSSPNDVSIIIHVRVRSFWPLRCLCITRHRKEAHCSFPWSSNAVAGHATNTRAWEEGQIGELTRWIYCAHCRSWNDHETRYTVATCYSATSRL